MNWPLVWSTVTDSAYYLILVDILAISWLVYRLLLLAKGTRAWQIITGIGVFFSAVFLTDKLNLYALNWLLREAFVLGPVALVILFLPELRHALEEFGRPGFWGRSLGLVVTEELGSMIDAVVAAATTMSVKRIGALIVFERENRIEDIIANGTTLNAVASSALLGTIFYKGSPLHDGAVVIRAGTVAAAGCTLPLTESPRVEAAVHTRHKAALGMSEESDAVILVISEETGTISIAVEGHLLRGFTEDSLRAKLLELLDIGDTHGISAVRIGQMATRVGEAIKQSKPAVSGRAERRSRKAKPE